MVREIKDSGIYAKVKGFSKTPFFIPLLFLFFLVLTIPVITLVTQKPTDFEQRATSQGLTATISMQPSGGTVAPGETFTADLVIDGGGQAFNAAQATVIASGNITVQSVGIKPIEQGGCNFTFANANETPSVNNLSFAGAILNSSSTSCTLYTVTLLAGQQGSGGISISNSQVKALEDSSEIFLSAQNGLYTISSAQVTPVPNTDMYLNPSQGSVPTGSSLSVEVRINTNGQVVNAVQTEITYPASLLNVVSIDDADSDFNVPAEETFSNGVITIAYGAITPVSGDLLVTTINFTTSGNGTANLALLNSVVLDSLTNSNVLNNAIGGTYTILASSTPTPVPPTATPVPPTATPVQPTSTPTQPTPTPGIVPTFTVNSVVGATYRPSHTLAGTKSTNATSIFINDSSVGVNYPSSTLWEVVVQLNVGLNAFSIFAQDSVGNTSNSTIVNISRHRIGDITGDNIIDLTDLSIFGSDWAKTDNLNNALSDMNEDGSVDLTDFSIFAKAYGN